MSESNPSSLQGDINQDGKRNNEDLDILKDLLSQYGSSYDLLNKLPEADKQLLDVNQDGEINYNDVVQLCKLLLNNDDAKASQMAADFQRLRQKLR